MENIIKSFLIILIFTSCSSNKENFKVINDLLIDDESFMIFHGIERTDKKNIIDTILLSKKTLPTNLINQYSLDFDALNSVKPFYNGYKIVWINPNNKISLSQSEIYFLRSQINDELINLDKVNVDYVIKVNSDSIYKSHYKYSYNKLKKVMPYYSFSKPLFNKAKNIAVLIFYNGTNSQIYDGNLKNCMLILKKINKKWIVCGYERDIGLSD